MTNFAPNLSSGPCHYCNLMAESGPEDMLRCDLCRNTVHVSCLKSGTPDGRLLGDNFFTFTCSLCQQSDQDNTIRAKLNTPQLLLLVLYNLHMTESHTSRKGFFHWKVHIYQFINQHWKEIFGPERHKKKKKALQASLSGQLSHYGQYFVSGYETLQDGGWYKLSMVLPPAQLIQQYTAEKTKLSTLRSLREVTTEVSIAKESVVLEEEPFCITDISFDSANQDDSSQGSWFMEKEILRPNSHPPLTLFDGEEETEEVQPDKIAMKESEEIYLTEEVDMEVIDVDVHDDIIDIKDSSVPTVTRTSLFTKNTGKPTKSIPKTVNYVKSLGEKKSLRALSIYEERKLIRELRRLQEAGPLLPHLHRLLRKLVVRMSKYEHGVPRFDLDAETSFYRAHNRLRTRKERIKAKMPLDADDTVRVLDRFQIACKEECQVDERSTSFLTKLIGTTNDPPALIKSPYTLRFLKPYILRDYDSTPCKLRVLKEIIEYPHRKDKNWTPPPRYPIDYCYVTAKHIPAMNQLARHFFWPGIDLSEVLQYPDHTCVVMYRHLVIGFGVLVPDTSFNTAYLSFLLVHPEWQRAGIATFILYHLIQTCMGKDITLHVSATNQALILYQKFGFKVEEFLLEFYDKYLPEDSRECKHAMFLRLSR